MQELEHEKTRLTHLNFPSLMKTPRQGGESCRGVGWIYLLVVTEAGDVSIFDKEGIVTLGFVEGKGEVLDAVGHAEFFEEQDELAQFFNEPVLIFD